MDMLVDVQAGRKVGMSRCVPLGDITHLNDFPEPRAHLGSMVRLKA
jgi:hypothetical protein